MKVCVLASGSKGNMTYIETKQVHLLIDAGIALTNAQKREQSINFKNITDIVITHEHGDHIGFLNTVMKKTNATVYMHKNVVKSIKNLNENLYENIRIIKEQSRYIIGDLEILTLKLSHDSSSILGFIFINDGKKVAYITDTGFIPEDYYSLLSDVDILIIESNHDVEMLINSDRDIYLKERILSSKGHMSNQKCLEALSKIVTCKQKYIILAHISEECNCDELLISDVVNKVKAFDDFNGEIMIARQHEALRILEI